MKTLQNFIRIILAQKGSAQRCHSAIPSKTYHAQYTLQIQFLCDVTLLLGECFTFQYNVDNHPLNDTKGHNLTLHSKYDTMQDKWQKQVDKRLLHTRRTVTCIMNSHYTKQNV